MNKASRNLLVGLCALGMTGLCILPASAQNSEVKEKPALYTYDAMWQIPRAHWADMPQAEEADRPILDKALADGTLVAYGNDVNLVHQADGYTHDDWWQSKSMAGLLNVLNQFYAANQVATPALDSATKHEDVVLVSRYYNWHTGPYKDALLHVSSYNLRPNAPDDSVDLVSKSFVVPLMEKLLADGTISEYEVDEQALHTSAPGEFWIVYVAPNAEDIDKANAALIEAEKSQPLGGPAFYSMIDFSQHRDELWRGQGVYK